jgi:RNA polymerase sigma factor (TIGR02999 family)
VHLRYNALSAEQPNCFETVGFLVDSRFWTPDDRAFAFTARFARIERWKLPVGVTSMERSPDRSSMTQLLRQWSSGDKSALDELMPVVYNQLHKLASRCLRAERPDHTLRATALVHEAYLRLVDADVAWQDRVHFFAVSARLLRRILVDHAKANKRKKRGAGAEKIPLDEAMVVGPQSSAGLLELDAALERLASQDRRKSEIIELLCFGGLTYDETAAALNISSATVHRELKLAKAWLHRELSHGAS